MSPLNSPQPSAGLLAIATVGSTSFPQLISSLLSPQSLSGLIINLNTSHLIIQFGHSFSLPSQVNLPSHIILQTNSNSNSNSKSNNNNNNNNLDIRNLTFFKATFSIQIQIQIQIQNQQQLAFKQPTTKRLKLELFFIKFTDSIDSLLSLSNIVISHAGAGSILSSLRPLAISPSKPPPQQPDTISISNSPFTIPFPSLPASSKKHIILIPNDSLMDNHQSELATQIARAGWAHTCSPDALPKTLQMLDSSTTTTTSSQHQQDPLNHCQPRSDEHSESDGDEPAATFEWVPDKFKRFLDLQMGFGALKTE